MASITLKKLDPTAKIPARATAGSLGYDLAVIADETVGPRETRILATGLQLAHDLPRDGARGLAMLVLPRSSLSLKFGLILPNSPGLVDSDYAGPIGVLVHNLRDDPVTIPAGTRVAQALFLEVRLPELEETGRADPARTRGGFGSTGS
jgi:dUTP pyrophosphatase